MFGAGGDCHIHWHRRAMHIPQSKFQAFTRVNSFARPCSPRGLFCGSHPSATSYSNGLTGEEEGAGGDDLIDGPMARGGGWVYEPEQIWILRMRPSCHTCHIKNYLTMHYVGDLSRKKDEYALPRGWNYNLRCSEEWLRTALCEFSVDSSDMGPIDRGPPHLLRVSDCQKKKKKRSEISMHGFHCIFVPKTHTIDYSLACISYRESEL